MAYIKHQIIFHINNAILYGMFRVMHEMRLLMPTTRVPIDSLTPATPSVKNQSLVFHPVTPHIPGVSLTTVNLRNTCVSHIIRPIHEQKYWPTHHTNQNISNYITIVSIVVTSLLIQTCFNCNISYMFYKNVIKPYYSRVPRCI